LTPDGRYFRLASEDFAVMITKAQMVEAIQSLPDDATIDDAMERLYVLAKIEIGLAQIEAGQGIPHDEIRRQISQWRG